MNSISTNMSSPASPTPSPSTSPSPTTSARSHSPSADRLSPPLSRSLSPPTSIHHSPSPPSNRNPPTATERRIGRSNAHVLRLASGWAIERCILVPPISWDAHVATAIPSSRRHSIPSSHSQPAEPEQHHEQRSQQHDDSTSTRAERPTQSAMASDPDTSTVASQRRPNANASANANANANANPQHQDQDPQQQQLKTKWKKIWLRGLSVRIRPRKDTLRRATTGSFPGRAGGGPATAIAAGAFPTLGPSGCVGVGVGVERGTQTTTAQQTQTLRQSETLARPSESDPLTDSDPSTAATTASHSPATSTTAQTTTVPSSSSSSSSTSLSVSVGASIGNFPSSSAPCPTCGQRRHVDLHRPPTPVKPEDRFHFRSGVPYGPWTITHPPPLPTSPPQDASEVPAAKTETCTESGTGPLTAFHPFSRLPPELRSKILRFYLERPRIVEIRCMNDLKKIHFAPNALGNLASNIAWSADNTLPALMWVNRECRAETRAFYRIQLPMHPTNKIAWPVIINPDYDTVIFTFPWSSEIPLDIFLSDCLAFDPLGVGIRHFGTRDRGGPETWDLTPVPGCAPLSKSLANLESYTEAIQLMDDRAAARFPVWMIHEGYLTSGIPAKDAFYQDVPRLLLSNDYEPPDATNQHNALNALRSQLGDYLPKDVAEKLVMQRMFYRKYFRHLRMKCTKTDLAGLGMVRQIPRGETEEFFLSNGRVVAGPRKKRRSALDVRPSSSWHLWDDD